MPTTSAAAQSMKPPPNTAQKPQAPAAEPKICSQAGFAGASRISFNFL